MAPPQLPVIVSIATLPSRIGSMRPTIESLLNGDLVPDRILVVVTEYSEREKIGYVIPDFLKDPTVTQGIVEVVVSSRDWGPGTKSLGALEHISGDCILVTADDDVAYKSYFLATLAQAQSDRRDCSFSYFTYRAGGLTVGQGCDGFSFYSPNLMGVRVFVEAHVVGTTLHFHDDLWISFFLFSRGVEVRAISPPDAGSSVYTQTIADESLRDLTGDASRDRIVSAGLPMLVRKAGLSTRQRGRLALMRFLDLARQLPARSLNRARIVAGSEKARI